MMADIDQVQQAQQVQRHDSEEHAAFVSVLAFRGAWHGGDDRNMASAAALKTYLDFRPSDQEASDKVVAAIIDAIRNRPHLLEEKKEQGLEEKVEEDA